MLFPSVAKPLPSGGLSLRLMRLKPQAPKFVGVPKVICAETRLKIHTIHSAPPISTVTYMIRLTYFVIVTCIIRKDNS